MPDYSANVGNLGSSRSALRSIFTRYAIALACIAGAFLIRWLLDSLLNDSFAFLTLYGGVAAAVWLSGWRPATLGAVAGFLLADYFFVSPRYHLVFTKPAIAGFIGYSISCGLIIYLGEAMRRARDRAEQQKELLATTLTSMGDGVIVTDASGKITSLNGEAERLTGWTNTEAVGKPHSEILRIVNEHTRQPADNPIENALRTGIVTGLANHTILLTKDGREIPIDDSAAPIRKRVGDPLGVVLVFRDVTAQRRAQKDQARLAEIVKYSGDAIFTKDLNGVINSWNESAKRLFGYEAEEVVGKPATVLFPRDRLQEEDYILARLRLGQPCERLETIRVRKDGTPIHVSVNVSPLKNGDGEIIGASKIIHDISELVTAREELMREKELLATTLASIGDGVILTDEKGRVTFLNTEAQKLTGWNTDDARSRPLIEVFKIVNEETGATVENPVEKVMRLGGVVGLANHTVLIAKDGREIPIDDSAAPIRQPGGPMFGIVLVFRDFTEHKLVEKTLRESEERFRTMANSAPVLIWISNLDKLCTWFNKQWLDFTGRTMEQELGNGWAEGVHPDDFDRCLKTYVESFDARKPFTMEYRLQRHDGEWRWILDHGVPIFKAEDVFAGYIGSCVDVTDRKRAEEALRERTHELESLLDVLPVAVWTASDPECRDIRGNQFAQELFGVPKNANVSQTSAVTETAFELPHFRDGRRLEPHELPMQRAASSGKPQSDQEIEVQVPDGRRIMISGSSVPLKDDHGKLRGVLGAFVDVTARKQAEAERERLLKSEQELRHLAEEANRLKDEFLAIMSHELRNPLNVILGYSELLLHSDTINQSPQLARMGEALKRNALTQSRLIRDLLDLSRLRSGKISLNLETVSLLTAINNAVETVRSDAEAKQIEIKVDCPQDVILVKGDPVRLEQIMWNLLNNSVKFTPSGGSILVELRRENNSAALSVTDTGQGMDVEFVPHVFEMFRQGDAAANRAQSGMGIGLAVVQQLVQLHDGSIKAFSEGRGKGSSFTVTLPLSQEVTAVASPILDLSSDGIGKLSVLVVDDSEDTVGMLAQMLSVGGAQVTTALSGADALRIIAEEKFDVVLTDISMPRMDGFEFLRRLRQLPGRSEVPVLAITGFGRPEDIARAKAEGFYGHIIKPFELDVLTETLRRLPKK